VFHIIPMRTNTFYKLDDECLFIKTGRIIIEIPYTSIVSLTCGVTSMIMEPALTFKNRIEIKYKTKGGITEIVHVSPLNEDEFIRILNSKIQ